MVLEIYLGTSSDVLQDERWSELSTMTMCTNVEKQYVRSEHHEEIVIMATVYSKTLPIEYLGVRIEWG